MKIYNVTDKEFKAYGQVLEAKLTAEEREKIFWKNTAELFGEGF